MNENAELSIILDMLLTIESRLSTLIEFQIDSDKLDLFNEATQKHREIIIQKLKGDFPSSIAVEQRGKY